MLLGVVGTVRRGVWASVRAVHTTRAAMGVEDDVQELSERIASALSIVKTRVDWDAAQARLDELNAEVESEDLWKDAKRAQKVMQERTQIAESIKQCDVVERSLADTMELFELAGEEGDKEVVAECHDALESLYEDARELELHSLLGAPHDANSCMVEVHAGAGGTESLDWADMLFRMYTRWGERRGFSVEVVDEAREGYGGLLKYGALRVDGAFAYGYAKHESGVHRLVRVSPFDSNARRHTSFASVGVTPVLEEGDATITVDPKDIRIDTMRAQGPGGQHVNTTDSAVRITHLPTGIVATASAKSQHRNRVDAMELLVSKLYEAERRKKEEAAAAQHATREANAWSSQIRSYVLHPYKMVKDVRTGVVNGNADDVLDGNLDEFMFAALAKAVEDSEGGQQ